MLQMQNTNYIIGLWKGVKSMSLLKDIFDSLRDEDKKVNISKSLYFKILEEVGGNEELVESLINKIIYERFSNLEKQKKLQLKQEEHEEQLLDYYYSLDKYLHSTLNRNIKIGITNGLVGYEDSNCIYTLKNYDMSYSYKYIQLILEKDNQIYPLTFHDVQDIRFLKAGDNLKTWIYMPKFNWKFYLNYDKNIFSDAIANNATSDKIDI